MTLLDKASIIIPRGAASKTGASSGVLYGFNPNTKALVPITTVQNTANLTRINEASLIENVLSNVLPRDFTNGGCGDYAIWPQRTNIFLRSNEIDNASWVKGNSGNGILPVVTANYAISPDGTNNADRVQLSRTGTAATDRSFISQTVTGALNTNYSNGVWLKSNTGVNQNILILGNFGTGSVKIVNVTNQWQRFQANLANTGGSTNVNITIGLGYTVMSETSADILVSYAQGEAGDYPSANIKTEGSTETRDAMVVSQSGLGSLIGQAEGGIFLEAKVFDKTVANVLSLSDGNFTNRLYFTYSGNIRVDGSTTGASALLSATQDTEIFSKTAMRYQLNNYALANNGSVESTDTSAGVWTNQLTDLDFGTFASTLLFYGRIRQLVIFNQAPTNSELIAITTN